MALRSFLQVCVAALPALASPTPASSSATNTNPTTTLLATATGRNTGLNTAATKSGKLWFGTAADIPGTNEINDPYYMKQFNNTCDFGEGMEWLC